MIKVFNDPIFRFSWMTIRGGTVDSAIKTFATSIRVEPWSRGPAELDGHFAAHSDHKCGLFWFKDKAPSLGLVAHEAFHGAIYAFDKLSISEVTEKNEELFAYYLQYLVEQLTSNKKRA